MPITNAIVSSTPVGLNINVSYYALGNDSWVNFIIVVSRQSDFRSKTQEKNANGNLISFCVMFLFFCLIYAYDIIIIRLRV